MSLLLLKTFMLQITLQKLESLNILNIQYDFYFIVKILDI